MNPYYQNPFQPYQAFQPTIPQAMQMPQVQPTPKTGIAGRLINNIEEVAANEVPMDGSVALFPSQDGSVIFAKAWNPDGTITTVRYTPVHTEEKQDVEDITLYDIMDELSDIRDLLKPKKTAAKKQSKKEDKDETE